MKLSTHTRTRMAANTARNLGWFSIALGVAELLFARRLARAAGLRGSEGALFLCGAREVVNGVGLLVAPPAGQARWMWARVAGDAVDIATAARHLRGRQAGRAAATVAMLAGVTALDVGTARALSGTLRKSAGPVRDYSGRSGFARPVEEMRGRWKKGAGAATAAATPPSLQQLRV